MTKTLFEASDVTRKALVGIDSGWFDAYWNAEHQNRKPGFLRRMAGSLWNKVSTARIRFGSPVRSRRPAITDPRADDLVAAGEG